MAVYRVCEVKGDFSADLTSLYGIDKNDILFFVKDALTKAQDVDEVSCNLKVYLEQRTGCKTFVRACYDPPSPRPPCVIFVIDCDGSFFSMWVQADCPQPLSLKTLSMRAVAKMINKWNWKWEVERLEIPGTLKKEVINIMFPWQRDLNPPSPQITPRMLRCGLL